MSADRPLWYPGSTPPAHLDGRYDWSRTVVTSEYLVVTSGLRYSLAGDYGFDPLSLGSDPEILKWFVQAELVHARFAMLGVAGIVLPGLAAKLTGSEFPEWYEAGEVYIKNHPEMPFSSLLATQLFMMGWVETKRLMDFRNPGSQNDPNFDDAIGISEAQKGMANGYPGGKLFDPLGYSRGDAAAFEQYKKKEIKNGRLAMLAFVGFVAQHEATGKGPIDNLFDHIADPLGATFATNGISVPSFTQF